MPKTSKDYLPKQIKLGHFVIDIQLIDGTVSLNIAEQQGSFIARDQVIYLDKEIMIGQPDRAINLIIHELMHAIYYQYNLSEKSCEEDVVNAMSNGMTELLTRTDLLQFIKHKLKEV